MLPALPKSFGRLTDVFASCLGSITGIDNRLSFARSKRVCAILVDGLGAANLRAAAGHAPYLNSALSASKPISCGFPSTTATSITSFATGLTAGQHGFVGYKVFDRVNQQPANLLTGWGVEQNASLWQPQQTISEKSAASGVVTYVVGPAEYAGSGFTEATMRKAQYVGAKTVSDRVDRALCLLNGKDDCLVYLYVPELDQAAHAYGSDSSIWLQKIEELDSQVRRFTKSLPKEASVCLTADHGIIDVSHDQQIYLDELISDTGKLLDVGGDPRVNFLYLADSQEAPSLASQLNDSLNNRAVALTRQQIIEQNWYLGLTETAIDRLPEVMVLATKTTAIYHREFAKPKSLQMIGQHGGLSAQELQIPLLGWGNFS